MVSITKKNQQLAKKANQIRYDQLIYFKDYRACTPYSSREESILKCLAFQCADNILDWDLSETIIKYVFKILDTEICGMNKQNS